MHDRRVEGETLIFGNQGALFMNNMTWWDHQTDSVWTQLTGEALSGPLQGFRLEMLPMSIEPWGTWLAQHPDTLVMEIRDGFNPSSPGVLPRDGFVIGIELGQDAGAYPFEVVSRERVVNDFIGESPLLVYADPETRHIGTFLRIVNDATLTFQWRDGRLVDIETASTWEPTRGVAIEGPLKGEVLLEIPYVTSFLRNWLDFHPASRVYPES